MNRGNKTLILLFHTNTIFICHVILPFDYNNSSPYLKGLHLREVQGPEKASENWSSNISTPQKMEKSEIQRCLSESKHVHTCIGTI